MSEEELIDKIKEEENEKISESTDFTLQLKNMRKKLFPASLPTVTKVKIEQPDVHIIDPVMQQQQQQEKMIRESTLSFLQPSYISMKDISVEMKESFKQGRLHNNIQDRLAAIVSPDLLGEVRINMHKQCSLLGNHMFDVLYTESLMRRMNQQDVTPEERDNLKRDRERKLWVTCSIIQKSAREQAMPLFTNLLGVYMMTKHVTQDVIQMLSHLKITPSWPDLRRQMNTLCDEHLHPLHQTTFIKIVMDNLDIRVTISQPTPENRVQFLNTATRIEMPIGNQTSIPKLPPHHGIVFFTNLRLNPTNSTNIENLLRNWKSGTWGMIIGSLAMDERGAQYFHDKREDLLDNPQWQAGLPRNRPTSTTQPKGKDIYVMEQVCPGDFAQPHSTDERERKGFTGSMGNVDNIRMMSEPLLRELLNPPNISMLEHEVVMMVGDCQTFVSLWKMKNIAPLHDM